MPIGKRVIIIGGLIHGVEVAEFLTKRGRQVTVVETSNELGTGIPENRNRIKLLSWLAKKGATLLTGVKYDEITDEGMTITDKEGKKQTIASDTIVVAVPPLPNTALFDALKGKAPEVYMVGDCKEPRLILDAISDGRQIGCVV